MTELASPPPEHREFLLRAYAAYNTQDVEGLLALVSDDVDWPDDVRRLHGKEQLRAYWTEQWRRTRTHDQPERISALADGRTAVHIKQVVRSLAGSVVSQGEFMHLHRIVRGRIVRLDIEAAPGS